MISGGAPNRLYNTRTSMYPPVCIGCTCFRRQYFANFRPRVVLVMSVAGRVGNPGVCTRLGFGPRLRPVERALGVQSRESWQVTTGYVAA